MARAMSASGRPLKNAGIMVTSPNGTGGCTRRVTRRLMVVSSSNPGLDVASQRAKLNQVPFDAGGHIGAGCSAYVKAGRPSTSGFLRHEIVLCERARSYHGAPRGNRSFPRNENPVSLAKETHLVPAFAGTSGFSGALQSTRLAPTRISHFSGGPIVTVSLPIPSTSHSILSPATVAATPDGVPVIMMSPASSSTISESFEMTSGTFQII
jgi:hypothetical protein